MQTHIPGGLVRAEALDHVGLGLLHDADIADKDDKDQDDQDDQKVYHL